MSKKRQTLSVTYRLAVEEWRRKRISEDGYLRCQFVFYDDTPKEVYLLGHDHDFDTNRCLTHASFSPHHRKGRGKWLAYSRYFMAVCPDHHRLIEDHKRWARKHRYILY